MVVYTCEICKKVFSKKSNYLTHLNKKNPCDPNEKIEPKTCRYCNKELCDKYYLRQHIETKCLKGPNANTIILNKKNADQEKVITTLKTTLLKTIQDDIKITTELEKTQMEYWKKETERISNELEKERNEKQRLKKMLDNLSTEPNELIHKMDLLSNELEEKTTELEMLKQRIQMLFIENNLANLPYLKENHL